jgi:Uma2 family endonuclease
MTQTPAKLLTFNEFLTWLPNQGKFELHDGVICPMNPPVGFHEDISCFLAERITAEYLNLNLPYAIARMTYVRSLDHQSGYLPDILAIDRATLATDSTWKQSAVISRPDAIPLIIEIVSTNWEDDYYKKLGDYEKLGVPEYWIVDYLALGARRLIGSPKQPTISVYCLVEREYQLTQFRNDDRIVSLIFPELSLTTNQIFNASLG